MPRADVAPLGLKKLPPAFLYTFRPSGAGPQNPLASAVSVFSFRLLIDTT
jgi:hypothetical protein